MSWSLMTVLLIKVRFLSDEGREGFVPQERNDMQIGEMEIFKMSSECQNRSLIKEDGSCREILRNGGPAGICVDVCELCHLRRSQDSCEMKSQGHAEPVVSFADPDKAEFASDWTAREMASAY